MPLSPEVVGAAAAILAAILSALTLAISVHRDERRWRRQALTEVLITFLDASFKGTRGHAFDADAQHTANDQQLAIDSNLIMTNSMTRLRMLAKAKVVRKAEELHDVLDDLYDVVYQPDKRTITEPFDRLVKKRQRLRDEFVELARKNLGLRGSAPIYYGNWNAGPRLRDAVEEVPSMRVHLLREQTNSSD